jgi:hypothetical protein
MFWSTRNGARSLFADLLPDILTSTSGMHILRLRRLGNDTLERCRADKLCLTLVPLGQYFRRRSAAEDAWVD